MRQLFIIGNGFDIHHGFKTKYSHFLSYLKINNPELLQKIDNYFFTGAGDDFWNEFEANLANFDFEAVVDELSNYLCAPGDMESEADRSAFTIESSRFVDSITTELRLAFCDFISIATNQSVCPSVLLPLPKDALYINFNYSYTLEKQYSIPPENITYIHGQLSNPESIILGHGADPSQYSKSLEEPPAGLSPEDLEHWYQDMSDNYDMDYENGVDELRSYFFESFKDTSKVIEHNSNFFNSLNNIREIYIFGHSMSEIDLPYFIEVKNKLTAPCFWCISYLKTEKMDPGEVEDKFLEAKQALLNIGIPDKHIKAITLNELAKNHAL